MLFPILPRNPRRFRDTTGEYEAAMKSRRLSRLFAKLSMGFVFIYISYILWAYFAH